MSLLVFSLLGCGAGSSSSGGATTPLPTTPAVLSISPSPLAANGGAPIQITLTGSGFVSASQVEVNGAAVSTTFLSATNLQATLPAAVLASGSQLSITVVNGTGPGSAAIILTVANPAPLVSALSPSAVPLGSATTVLTLTGSGFVPSTTLTLNGVAHAVSYTNGTQLALTLSAADVSVAGTETVVAVNPAPGGGSSPPFTFAVTNPLPVVTALSPASATVGAGPVTLSVAGSGFLPTTTLTFNGAAHAATYVSGTLLNVTLSPADLLTAGNASVVVANPAPGGGSSAAVALPVVNPAPVLSTITPASASVGAVAFTLDLEGSSFTAASVVLWNGTALPTTFLSTTELKAQVGAGQLSAVGSATVAVSTPVPGGGVSNAVSFTITVGVPVLTGISPHTVPQNGAAVINLVGSGFTGASVVNWNGSPRPTTFLSATSLQVNLSAQDLSRLVPASSRLPRLRREVA